MCPLCHKPLICSGISVSKTTEGIIMYLVKSWSPASSWDPVRMITWRPCSTEAQGSWVLQLSSDASHQCWQRQHDFSSKQHTPSHTDTCTQHNESLNAASATVAAVLNVWPVVGQCISGLYTLRCKQVQTGGVAIRHLVFEFHLGSLQQFSHANLELICPWQYSRVHSVIQCSANFLL